LAKNAGPKTASRDRAVARWDMFQKAKRAQKRQGRKKSKRVKNKSGRARTLALFGLYGGIVYI
jgi:hypothetical protein